MTLVAGVSFLLVVLVVPLIFLGIVIAASGPRTPRRYRRRPR